MSAANLHHFISFLRFIPLKIGGFNLSAIIFLCAIYMGDVISFLFFFHLIPYEWSTLKWSMFVCLPKWMNFPPFPIAFHSLISITFCLVAIQTCFTFGCWYTQRQCSLLLTEKSNGFFLRVKFSNENQIKIFPQYIYISSVESRHRSAPISMCFCLCDVYLWRKAQNYCKWNSLHHSWKLNKSDINVPSGDHTMEKLVFIRLQSTSVSLPGFLSLSLTFCSPFYSSVVFNLKSIVLLRVWAIFNLILNIKC